MNKQPEVSVIMPAFNVEKYIAQSIDSVLRQTFKNFEFIIIDDGSQDNTLNMANDYAVKDKRIKLVKFEKNGGQSAARNAALDIVRGQYIMFMDSDDFIHPQTMEIALHFAKKHDTDIVSWRIKHLFELGTKVADALYQDFDAISFEITDNPVKMYGEGTMNSSCNKLFRRDFLGATRYINGVIFEDNAFILELFRKKPKLCFLDVTLYNYVCYNYSSSTWRIYSEKTFQDYNTVFRAIYNVWKDAPRAETRFITDHLFKESKNFLRTIRRCKHPDNVKRAFANLVADIDRVGWLRMPRDLSKIHKIKHLIRLKYYIKKYADKEVRPCNPNLYGSR
ncbi:MAG: glycosyltransferase [Alphaproteobacteria bacterium]|nr:glycosyltransferase [Alphaproteobacteria bacterium]